MRVLCKCAECGNWFQHETGAWVTEELVATLVASVPRVYDVVRCGSCKSLDARNDFHWFFEEFQNITSAGIGDLDLMPAPRPEVS